MQVQDVQAPPVKNPLDMLVAQLHVAANWLSAHSTSLIGGIVLLIVGWFVAKLVARGVRRTYHRHGREDLGGVLASIVFGIIVFVAVMIAAVIVFPSVKPVTIISSLGVGSVAIGFAFKDILQNLLAGILLLINRPYRRGDQIVVKDFEGEVEHIESRATLIKTYDGRRVIIPNSDVYTSPVTVNTAFPKRRDEFDVGIGYGDKPAHAAEIFLAAIKAVDGVESDPVPEVLPWGLDDSYITLRARWWTESRRSTVVHVRSRVILAIWEAAAEHGIDFPFPTRTVLFHDQTEETDGDRTRQREGWPAGKHPPRPRWREEQDDAA